MDAPKFIKSNFGDDKEKVEDLLSDEETHRIVKKCLQMLTKEQRSLLLMRISGGINYLSFKEMAERKKCSENEVRELVIAGIKVLCKQLSKETSLKIKYTKEEFENLELLNDLKDVTDQNKAPEGGTQ
ncbi:MAG: hypothetical protein LBE38_08145 [Deltaproteobacteria bacterium]|jgi:DNA-directed RNA polymerase specialized sigma24 family protein|nr:hypothetical protein [Deltaproteobacteria bacterium]